MSKSDWSWRYFCLEIKTFNYTPDTHYRYLEHRPATEARPFKKFYLSLLLEMQFAFPFQTFQEIYNSGGPFLKLSHWWKFQSKTANSLYFIFDHSKNLYFRIWPANFSLDLDYNIIFLNLSFWKFYCCEPPIIMLCLCYWKYFRSLLDYLL